jgi:hypothetical protein
VFTSALVEGLSTGDADRDEDGLVSLNELYDYRFDQVREHNPAQTPGRNFDLQGELYVAKSRRKRIRPTPLPTELQAATVDPNPFTRLGAITELRSKVVGEDLGVARAAYEALKHITSHDITQVAAEAQAAVAAATLRVSTTHLTLGTLTQGTDPPEQAIHLGGPALARAVTTEASQPWLRLRLSDDRLHVIVATARVGDLVGELLIHGVTGDATVTVTASIRIAYFASELRHARIDDLDELSPRDIMTGK